MDDRDEITALVHRYAELLDGGDLEGLVDLFSRATWRSATTGAVRRTPEEIRAVYEGLMPAEGRPRTRHVITNLVIDMARGADEATGRCSYTVLQAAEPSQPIRVLVAGRYDDRYRHGVDGWHLTDRLFHVDLA
jgi:3-phenylpropionate/cinnamic acid dioxygenase small subunit